MKDKYEDYRRVHFDPLVQTYSDPELDKSVTKRQIKQWHLLRAKKKSNMPPHMHHNAESTAFDPFTGSIKKPEMVDRFDRNLQFTMKRHVRNRDRMDRYIQAENALGELDNIRRVAKRSGRQKMLEFHQDNPYQEADSVKPKIQLNEPLTIPISIWGKEQQVHQSPIAIVNDKAFTKSSGNVDNLLGTKDLTKRLKQTIQLYHRGFTEKNDPKCRSPLIEGAPNLRTSLTVTHHQRLPPFNRRKSEIPDCKRPPRIRTGGFKRTRSDEYPTQFVMPGPVPHITISSESAGPPYLLYKRPIHYF